MTRKRKKESAMKREYNKLKMRKGGCEKCGLGNEKTKETRE